MPPALSYRPCAVNALGPRLQAGGALLPSVCDREEKRRLLLRMQTTTPPEERIDAVPKHWTPS